MGRWRRADYPGEYNSYTQMKRRLRDEQRPLHEAFETFDDFMDVLRPKPTPDHTLERLVRDGTYSPENVVWGTKQEQANNRRNTHYLTYEGTKHPEWFGEKLPQADWARRLGVPPGRLRQRVANGWSDTEVVDGQREKRNDRHFSEMTQKELAEYRPWRQNVDEAEARYVAGRYKNEARLEYRVRMIAEFADHKWQQLFRLLKEPDAANLKALRHSKQARDVLPRRPGVTDDHWYQAYANWEKVEGQLREARLELAEWASAAGRAAQDHSMVADREVLKRIKGQASDDDDLPDMSWLD